MQGSIGGDRFLFRAYATLRRDRKGVPFLNLLIYIASYDRAPTRNDPSTRLFGSSTLTVDQSVLTTPTATDIGLVEVCHPKIWSLIRI